jgi:hypothetical protein
LRKCVLKNNLHAPINERIDGGRVTAMPAQKWSFPNGLLRKIPIEDSVTSVRNFKAYVFANRFVHFFPVLIFIQVSLPTRSALAALLLIFKTEVIK